MTRPLAARLFAQSVFARSRRPGGPQPTRLGILALEERVVPQATDLSGLRFEVPGTFNQTTSGGTTTYQSGEPIAVGLVPQGGAAFAPLFRLADGGSVLDAGSPALSTFTWTNRVTAVTSGGASTLFAGKSESQTFAATLPATDPAAPHDGGQAVPLGPFTLTPTGFRIRSANQLGVGGTVGVTDFGGFTLPVGADKIVTAPTDAGASLALATIEGGFKLGANPSFGVAGLSFQPTPNAALPDVGGYVRITRATNRVEVAGSANFALGGNPVSVTVGQYDPADPSKFVAGAAFQGGALQSLAAAVKTAVKLGGLAFTADTLTGTYDAAGAKFTVTGDTKFALGGSDVSVKLGGGATPGLVVANGRVTNADFTVTSTIKVGGLEFKAANLAATYTDATKTYSLRGGASFDLKGSTVGVTFGGRTTAGLVVTDGTVTSADFTVDAKVVVGGLTFTATDLRATYANATGTYTVKGTAAFAIKDSTVAVTFGDKATAGLVIVNGVVTSADFAVDATLALGGVTFAADKVRATYTDADSTFTLKGAATFALEGSTVAVTLGDAKTVGLVLVSGAVKSLDFTVNTKVVVGGVTVTAKDLRATYTDADSKYTVAGTATATVVGLGALNLTIGSDGKPGLVIANGSLTSLDATVNSDVTVAGVKITTTGLNLKYAASDATFTLAGDAKATITGLGELGLTFGSAGRHGVVIQNGSLVSLDATLNSNLKVAGVTITATGLRLTYTAATGQYTLAGTGTATIDKLGVVNLTFGYQGKPGLVVQDGALSLLDLTLNSDLTVSKVTIKTTGLNLIYTAANSQFTLAGAASATIDKLGTLGLTFGAAGKPGLVLKDGVLTSLDLTLTSDLTVSKVRFTLTGLNLTYTAADGQFTLAGPSTATIDKLGTLGLTFGAAGKPGLVVTEGALVSLDVTLTSDITVSGVRLTTAGLDLTYTAATTTFTLAGAATATVTGLGVVNLTFGAAGKPGLVVAEGALVSLDLTLNSDLTVSGVKITTTGLNLTYTEATKQFTLAGAAEATIDKLGKLGVTFGFKDKAGKETPGLVVQNGSLVSLDVTLTSDLTVSKVKITTTGLRLTYTGATNQFTLTGAAQATIDKLGNVGVTFGFQGNPGLVVQDGSLTFLDLTLNADITVSKVRITTTGMRLTYTAATNQFSLAGSAQATIEKFGTVGVTFGFQGKPGLVVRDGSLVSVDVTLTSDVTISNVKITTTGLELSYTADGDRFTLTGPATVTVPQFGTVAVTFGYDNKPGLVVENGALKSLDLRINSNFTFLKYTFTVENLDLSYTADGGKFTVRGKASVDLLLGSFAIQLGDGNGGQGLVIVNGKVVSIDATVSGEVGVAFVSLGKVTLNLKYDGATGQFDIRGDADITLAIKLPNPAGLFLSGPSFHVGRVSVHVRVVPGDNARSFTDFSAATSRGNRYTLKITFSGEVTSDGLSQALFDGLKNAVANTAKTVGNAVTGGAKSVLRFGRRLFGRDNELVGATMFFDLNLNGVLDAGEPFALTEADGSVSLTAPAGGGGQLVVFGGKNVGTNQPNTLVLTAPATATQASPLSTLLQAIRAAQPGLSEADAMVYVEVAFGVPGSVDPLNDGVIQAALGGSKNEALAFAADIQVAILAKGFSALIGAAASDGRAAFAVLAAAVANAGGPLDLADPAVVGQLLRDTAGRLGVTLDPALVNGAATVLAGVVARTKAIPAPDGTDFVRELNQVQLAAETEAFPMLAAAAAGTMGIDAVVAAQTGAAFDAEVKAEQVGVLAAAASNTSPLYAIGAGPGGGPMVRVYDRQTKALVSSFYAFDPKFTGGVTVAVGDVTGDGVPDVVVAAGDGGHARVIVIDGTKLNAVGADGQIDPAALVASFFAFEEAFTGGATVCLARLDSGPGLNIVVGAGVGGGPRVRSFNWAPEVAGGVTQLPGKIGDFFALDPAARVGVNVAAGDLDGLGRDDLIVGAGIGGGPVVAIYLADGTLRDLFMAGDPAARGGVSVAAGFLDGTSTAQLVTASGPGSPAVVNVYRGDTLTLERSAAVFGSDFTGGARVSVGPDGDGDPRVVVGAGPGGGPRVGVLDAELQSVGDFFGFEPTFRGGVNVG